jgi:hypothetical protein
VPPISVWLFDSRPTFVVSQIGHGDCTGFGSSVMPPKRTNLPSNGASSRVQR